MQPVIGHKKYSGTSPSAQKARGGSGQRGGWGIATEVCVCASPRQPQNRTLRSGRKRTLKGLGHGDRGRPALRCAVAAGARRVGVDEHLLARPQVARAVEPDELAAEVGLEAAPGLDVVWYGDRVLLHAARPHGDLHMQRRVGAAAVRHDDHRQLTVERRLELLPRPNAWRHGDGECLQHRAVGAGRATRH